MSRIRRHRPTAVLGSCARRAREIARVILAGFVPGPSTRRIDKVLLPLPGLARDRQPRRRDTGCCRCRLDNRYKALMPDGVVLARRIGAGAVRGPTPVALGIPPDGRNLILDNCSTHKTALIHQWLARHPRFHLHFTPTGASRLNLVDRRFALLTERQLRRGRRTPVSGAPDVSFDQPPN